MPLNPTAENYRLAAADYEAGRPGYPDAVVEALPLKRAAIVVDLGAGTGKFTRLLVPRLAAGGRLIAVEPVAEMAVRLARLHGVSIVHSAASDTKLPAGVADLVTCAQAFHWFDDEASVAEIARILRPSGTLAFVWNLLDQRVPWAAALLHLTETYAGSTPRPQTGRWRWILSDPRFRFDREVTATNLHVVSYRALLARVFSISYLANLPASKHRRVCAQIDDILRTHGIQGGVEITVPYVTHLYLLRRR